MCHIKMFMFLTWNLVLRMGMMEISYPDAHPHTDLGAHESPRLKVYPEASPTAQDLLRVDQLCLYYSLWP